MEGLLKKLPLGMPMIDPRDVAPMVLFLASDEARMASAGDYSITAGDSANIQSCRARRCSFWNSRTARPSAAPRSAR